MLQKCYTFGGQTIRFRLYAEGTIPQDCLNVRVKWARLQNPVFLAMPLIFRSEVCSRILAFAMRARLISRVPGEGDAYPPPKASH